MGIDKLVLGLVLASVVAAQGQASLPVHDERISIWSHDNFPNPVPVPPPVVRLLLRDKTVKDSMDRATEAERKNPARLFRAAEVHLRSANEVDLLVVGMTPIQGADNGWFWVVRSAYKSPKIVLFTTGYSVEVMSSRTNGYLNLLSAWSNPNGTETHIYKFDGARYKLRKETWRENH